MKKVSRLFTIFLSAMVLLASFPIQTEAATIKLNKTTATVYVGSSTTLKLIGTSKKQLGLQAIKKWPLYRPKEK